MLQKRTTLNKLLQKVTQKNCEKTSQCLHLCGLPKIMCNTEKNNCSVCHKRMCESNFPL